MATFTYDDFRISFAAGADGVHAVTAVDQSGMTTAGTFRLPAEGVIVGAIQRIARSRAGGAAATRDVGGATSPAPDARRLGALLAGALLTGSVGERYESALAAAEQAGRGLRLSLSLADAPELLGVPWEFIYRAPLFVASQRTTPIVRVLETGNETAAPTIAADVRILGVVSNPVDLAPLDVAAERRRVEQALAAVIELGRVTLDWLDPATPRRLREVLRDGNYHVLHYAGHSDFTTGGEGVLFLEDAAGAATPVNSTVLANLLAEQSDLRLVVLNSCSAARTSLSEPYAGVATTLIQLGVPAVVAMQFPISDDAAITFGEELFTNLVALQEPIDAAVAEARKAIFVEVDDVEWATPVLFLRDPDVELLRFERPPVTPRRPVRRRLIIAAAALLVAAAGTVGLVVARRGPTENAPPPDADAVLAGAATRSLDYAFEVELPDGTRGIRITPAELADVGGPSDVDDPADALPGDLTELDWHSTRDALVVRRFVAGGWTGCELCVLLPETGQTLALAPRQAAGLQHAPAWDIGGRNSAYYAATEQCEVGTSGCLSSIMYVNTIGSAPVELMADVPGLLDIDVDPRAGDARRLLVRTTTDAFVLDDEGTSGLYRGDEVIGLAYSPNGNRIVGIARDGRTVLVWNNDGDDITSTLWAETTIQQMLRDIDAASPLTDVLDELEMLSISSGRDRRQPQNGGEFAVLVGSSTTLEAFAVVTLRADDDGPDTQRVRVVDVQMLPTELTSQRAHVRTVAQ